ncbi:MAG: hypothetical protein IJA77_13410 [Clostridia bacterium]|nr:hypothetical protein [Clostridia bacterium]
MSKFVTKLFALLLICMMIPTAYADASMPPADQISPDLTHASYSWRNPARSADYTITYVESGISALSGGLYLYGCTEADCIVDAIGGIVDVERWEDGQWKTYMQAYFEDYGKDSCELSYTMSVEGGYYYRLVITHTAEKDVDILMITSTTKSVYVY